MEQYLHFLKMFNTALPKYTFYYRYSYS